MSGDKKDGSILGQIILAVTVALLAGGSAPWWWDKFFPIAKTPVPTPTPSTPTPTPTPTPTASPDSLNCILTISNTLVPLMSKPERFSQELTRVRPGNYTSLDYVTANFGGLKEEGWFKIESEGRQGWIVNDTWTINSKSSKCP